MDELKFLDEVGLQHLINYFNGEDAKAIKKVYLDDATRTIKFFKDENALDTSAGDFTVTIPDDVDVSTLLQKIVGGVENNVVTIGVDGAVKDSGTAISDLATKTEVEEVSEKVGELSTLNTTAKTDVVAAINEVNANVAAGGQAGAITIEEDDTNPTYAKVYTIKQGGVKISDINIPKDMVVQSGAVVVNPDGQAQGTYIELTIANYAGDKIYVNVADLIENYKAKAGATQIQLAIDNLTREISGTIVAGSVTDTELAENSVTTAKIADANVTLVKLAVDVTNAFDSAGSATTAETNAKQYTDEQIARFKAITTDEIDAML